MVIKLRVVAHLGADVVDAFDWRTTQLFLLNNQMDAEGIVCVDPQSESLSHRQAAEICFAQCCNVLAKSRVIGDALVVDSGHATHLVDLGARREMGLKNRIPHAVVK